MLVQCKLIRKGGTQAEFGGVTYHFAPNEAGDHVCDITDEAALNRFVNEIPEGFAPYGDDAGKKAAKPKQAASVHPLEKPATMNITNPVTGDTIDLLKLDLDALRTFAKDELGLELRANLKVETIRTKIVDAMTATAHEEIE